MKQFAVRTAILLALFCVLTIVSAYSYRDPYYYAPRQTNRQKRQFFSPFGQGVGPAAPAVVAAPAVPATRVFTQPVAPATVVAQPSWGFAPAPVRAIPVPAAPMAVHVPHTESYVWQSGPTYTYHLHQRHPAWVSHPSFNPSWSW